MGDMQRDVAGWLRAGAVRYHETVAEGLELGPAVLVQMLAGHTVGKALVRIA